MTATRSSRRRPENGPVAAPSRMHSKRQRQIVQMVKGYDSTFTLSVAMRNLFLVWAIYGMALALFGALTFSANPLTEAGQTTRRTLEAIHTGGLLLFLMTFVMCGAWVAKSVANVRRLGRKARIGVLTRFRRHLIAAAFGLVALMFALFIPPLALVLVLVAIGLFFYSQMWIHLVVLDVVKMLWGTSSPPNGQHEDVDHFVLIWFWSWVVFITLFAGDASPSDVSITAAGGFMVVAGAACVVSALLASRLVITISRRQDARLFAIIHEVEDNGEKPVTDTDIEAAWNRSAGLIEMPH